MGRCIVVANQKGGVGKTTTAINLSAILAENEKKVLIIDIDPQANATSGLGFDKNNLKLNIYDCIINKVEPTEVIIETKFKNLYILPSNVNLVGAQVEMINMPKREFLLKEIVSKIKDNFDFIFIDTPPSLGILTLNGLVAADSVLIPIQCEYYAMEGLSQLLNTIKIVRQRLNPYLKIEGILFTMYDSRTNLSGQVVADVSKYLKDKIFKTIIPRNVKLSEAPSFGIPINKYQPDSIGAISYKELSKEILQNG
jgi:chromosome partitioning protein